MSRLIDKIVIHCSDSPQGRGDNASTIHNWHKERGFDGRAYVFPTCKVCAVVYSQQKRLYNKAIHKDLCKEHRRANPLNPVDKPVNCVDCGVSVCRGHERCKPCHGKHKANPVRLCECGAVLSHKAKKSCLACWNKEQDKGLSKERVKFQNSHEWTLARNECFERDNHTCQHCDSRGGYLEAHHIKEWVNYPSLRLEISNLLTLCRPCHRAYHKQYGRPARWAA